MSPAAPLELGDFLSAMAGKVVFSTAMKGALALRLVTALQRLGVYLSVDAVVRAMFKDSPDADVALLADPVFRSALIAGLRTSYGGKRRTAHISVFN